MGLSRDERNVMLAVVQNDATIPPLIDGQCSDPIPVEIDPQKPFQFAIILPPKQITTADGFSLSGVVATGFNETADIRTIYAPGVQFEGVQLLSGKPPQNQMTLLEMQTVDTIPQLARADGTIPVIRDIAPLKLSTEREEEVFTVLLWQVRDQVMQAIINEGMSPMHEMILHESNVKQPLAAFKVRLIPMTGQTKGETSM
ncbi:MAG: hypothetical protein Greene041662_1055 [Candidatus Peregrinibacteria bacterium Greene0416_62]|nr:MAG: hypothetical protein Greene041662_1055 [Candidatus Peregrinibacteria bacterium Greene0416_62]